MKLPRLWIPVFAVLLIVAVGVGFYSWRQSSTREDLVSARLAALAIELERTPTDRQSLQNEVRPLRELIQRFGPRPDLVGALAQAELALGRPHQALDALKAIDVERSRDPAIPAVAARALAALQAVSGKPDEAAEAAVLAERSHHLKEDPALLMLAWQSAVRAGRPSEAARLAEELLEHHGDSVPGRLVAALLEFEQAAPEQARAAALRARLQALELEFPVPPPELSYALATFQIEQHLQSDPPQGESELLSAHARLKSALDQYPAYVAGRSAMAVACHTLGRQPERDSHLRWLLSNAPQDDGRREQWMLLQQAPVR